MIKEDLVIVRTDYRDDNAWTHLLDAVQRGRIEDDLLVVTDDPGWADADVAQVLAAVPDECEAGAVFLADHTAMTRPDHALLAAATYLEDADPEVCPTLRIDPSFVLTVHVNLLVANQSWEDYHDRLDDPQHDVLNAD